MSGQINADTHTGPSFSLRNRLGRLAWGIVAATLFRWSPRSLHGWRRFLLNSFGAKVAPAAHIYPGVRIWAPWDLEVASEAGVASGVILYSQGKISIGYRAVISQGAHLCAGTHDYEVDGFPLITKPITIGAHAWVAAEAFIHSGVTIGAGCVIGARSVVTKDMPEWSVCSGFPCKPLKAREWRPRNEDA